MAFPFGEAWVEENSNSQRTPYHFTSKELDADSGEAGPAFHSMPGHHSGHAGPVWCETGLYYYGARYYDPRTSVWQSPDVVLDRYLDGFSAGGIYNSNNMSFYSYAYQNPVKYTDPNGKWVETAWDVFNIGLGVASFVDNVRQGKYGAATLDAVGVVADTVAAVVPVVPGGVGSTIKAARAADAGVDALKKVDKAADLAKGANKSADAAKTAKKVPCSFVAGTLVMTKEGVKPIEQIKAGDYVLARNDRTGEQSWRKVVMVLMIAHMEPNQDRINGASKGSP